MGAVRFINGNAALSHFIFDLKEDAQRKLIEGDHVATKALINSVSGSVNTGPAATTATLSALDYWVNVGSGTPPGTRVAISKLITWGVEKGVIKGTESVHFAMAVSDNIFEFGSRDFQAGNPNTFGLAVQDAQDRIPAVLQAFLQDVDNGVIEQFKRTA